MSAAFCSLCLDRRTLENKIELHWVTSKIYVAKAACVCHSNTLSSCWMQTLENTREQDETVVQAEDDEIEADEAQDEYAGEFDQKLQIVAHVQSLALSDESLPCPERTPNQANQQ